MTTILGSGGNVRVLRALVDRRVPQSVTELSRAAGLSPRGARLVLEALVAQQLVAVHGTGRAQLYVLSESHPFASALIALFQRERQRGEAVLASIRDRLDEQRPAVKAAWLYGSVARGEDTPQSDLDLAVVVTSHRAAERVREALMAIEDEQQIQISLTALTPEELAALPDDDRWWADVVRDARILKGSSPQAVKQQMTKAHA